VNHAELSQTRSDIATACRVLTDHGVMRETTGHVSLRTGERTILIRCRAADEPGLARTRTADIREVSFDAANPLTDGYHLPGEFALHREIYLSRPDVTSIVHGHPRASLLCGLMGLALKPIIGAYARPAMLLGKEGIPLFASSVLISTAELGKAVAEVLGDHTACLLRGHGSVVTGASLQDVVVKAINLETLADLTLEIAKCGREVTPIADDEVQQIESFVNTSAPRSWDLIGWRWNAYTAASSEASDRSV
jgi:ribulose-5-phosphate 4-epimerase/fuculose-1-phosphate aldolase